MLSNCRRTIDGPISAQKSPGSKLVRKGDGTTSVQIFRRRNWLALGLALMTLYFVPAKALLTLAISDDYYNGYLLMMPIVSGLMIYLDRNQIFRISDYSPRLGSAVIAFGITLSWWASNLSALERVAYGLQLSTFSSILIGAGGFLMCFGTQGLRRAGLPLGFLLMVIPLPAAAMRQIVLGLQQASATFSMMLFRLLHVPALREGLRFSLPGLNIEIKEHCSGIRSCVGLSIASILAGRLFIKTWWKRLIPVLLTIPVVIFKNAARIVTISWMGIYLNRRFLQGPLHDYGGIVFSLFDLAIITPIVVALYRSDIHRVSESQVDRRPLPVGAELE